MKSNAPAKPKQANSGLIPAYNLKVELMRQLRALFSRKRFVGHPVLQDMPWSIAEGNTAEYVFQIRFRHFDASFPRQAYPQRLNIFWALAEADAEGFPSADELARIHAFEDRLVNAVETDAFSVLSMVLTGRNEREFVFHTSDVQEFLRRLAEMPQEVSRYPIEIRAHDDPAWAYVDGVVGGIQRE